MLFIYNSFSPLRKFEFGFMSMKIISKDAIILSNVMNQSVLK